MNFLVQSSLLASFSMLPSHGVAYPCIILSSSGKYGGDGHNGLLMRNPTKVKNFITVLIIPLFNDLCHKAAKEWKYFLLEHLVFLDFRQPFK